MNEIQFFFKHYASHMKNQNDIWEMKDEFGSSHSRQEDIENEVVRYFKTFYDDSEWNTIVDQVNAMQHYPSYFTKRDVQELGKPIFAKEIKLVMKIFSREKSPGPEGWTVEFFLMFFDLIGNDVLEVVEESRRSDSMIISLNLAFIALIPKVDNPSNFGDFRPISLCNLSYKIIAKTIAIRLKPFLSKSLSLEQFGF